MRRLLSLPIRVWLTGAIVIVIVVTGFLTVPLIPTVNAATEEETPLDCLSCHTRVLKSHDKLGSGSEACWACHDSINIGTLRLADGTQLPLADSPPLCGQCHGKHYDAWQERTHGILSGKAELEFLGDRKLKCVACHNPHQPKIELSKLEIPSSPTFGSGAPLDCLSCHARILKGHDKLGSGSKACWACHYNREMGVLHLATEEDQLPLSDYPQLCAQCHQKRYEAWIRGTHGAPAWKEGSVDIHGTQRVGCIGCHDPHQPQIAFLDITKPHPEPAPPPSQPPIEPLIVLGISLALMIAAGIVVVTRGEET